MTCPHCGAQRGPPELVRIGTVSRPILPSITSARVVLCPEMLANVDISALRYFAARWPDRKRRAVAWCAEGRPLAEVAAGAARWSAGVPRRTSSRRCGATVSGGRPGAARPWRCW